MQPADEPHLFPLSLAPLLLVAALQMIGGCRLFERNVSRMADSPNISSSSQTSLPTVRRMPETVGLEIIFAKRPVDDPLLSDEQLWQGVDTVGALRPELRLRLQRNGLQVGHASSAANPAIETMLGLTSESTGIRAPVDSRKLVGRRVIRPVGGFTEVETNHPVRKLHFTLDDQDEQQDEPDSQPLEFENARCVLRVKAERLQDGWAKLEFTPEIHHGRLGWRPMATEVGWKGTTSQKVHRLYHHRFSLTLNTGEMAVITGNHNRPGSLGARFFLDGNGMQRVLFVRLADVATREPISTTAPPSAAESTTTTPP